MWHNYGGVMEQAMSVLIDTFNATIGKEQGIIVRVDAVSSSSELAANLDLILADDPVAQEMPNIAISYPKTAIKLADKGLLADLTTYFTKDKLSLYVDEFIEEGKINEALYVFPVAKSTEVLFVNQTLFGEFSKATGVTMESLSTFSGICSAADAYYDWCGKAFFTADSWFNLFSVAEQQVGSSFIADKKLQTESDSYLSLSHMMEQSIEKGGIRVYSGYSSDLAKTGDIVCSLGSTAGILYYGDTITYPDNTSIPVEYTILPYPTTVGGKKVALQRGNGMIVKKASPAEEYASALFLEWLTKPEQNLLFIQNTGYLPVTKEAFSAVTESGTVESDNINIQKLLKTAVEMQKDYSFYIPPVFEEFDSLSKGFDKSFLESHSN